jgi:hypothetical protein
MTLLLETDDGAVCAVRPQWTDVVAPDPEIVLGGQQRALFRSRTCWNSPAWWIGSAGAIRRGGESDAQGKLCRRCKYNYAATG